jgi:sulfopyruvate decarboxylase subunit beta
MRRIDAIWTVASSAEDALIVCNLGFPSRELYSVADRPSNFYMLGSMGLSSSIGLGLALARPEKRVISIDGDGAVLMNLGTLTTIASFAPQNYLLVIMDNCAYCSTGCQPTATAKCTDLARVAEASGIKNVRSASTQEELALAIKTGGVVVAKVEPGNADAPIIDILPHQILERFREISSQPSGRP